MVHKVQPQVVAGPSDATPWRVKRTLRGLTGHCLLRSLARSPTGPVALVFCSRSGGMRATCPVDQPDNPARQPSLDGPARQPSPTALDNTDQTVVFHRSSGSSHRGQGQADVSAEQPASRAGARFSAPHADPRRSRHRLGSPPQGPRRADRLIRGRARVAGPTATDARSGLRRDGPQRLSGGPPPSGRPRSAGEGVDIGTGRDRSGRGCAGGTCGEQGSRFGGGSTPGVPAAEARHRPGADCGARRHRPGAPRPAPGGDLQLGRTGRRCPLGAGSPAIARWLTVSRPAPGGGGGGSPLARVLVALVELYRTWLSPMLLPSCRFDPTCSAYAVEALRTRGALVGAWLTVVRVAKCAPWHSGGWDPVPQAPHTTAPPAPDNEERIGQC